MKLWLQSCCTMVVTLGERVSTCFTCDAIEGEEKPVKGSLFPNSASTAHC